MPKEMPEHLGALFWVKGGVEGMEPELLCSTEGSPGSGDAVSRLGCPLDWDYGTGMLSRQGRISGQGCCSGREGSLDRDVVQAETASRQG